MLLTCHTINNIVSTRDLLDLTLSDIGLTAVDRHVGNGRAGQ